MSGVVERCLVPEAALGDSNEDDAHAAPGDLFE